MNMVRKKIWCIQNVLSGSLTLFLSVGVLSENINIAFPAQLWSLITFYMIQIYYTMPASAALTWLLSPDDHNDDDAAAAAADDMTDVLALPHIAHIHIEFTVFRSLPVQQSTLHKPTNIVKHWCKQGNKRFTAARYGLLMLLLLLFLASIFQFAWRTQIDCIR